MVAGSAMRRWAAGVKKDAKTTAELAPKPVEEDEDEDFDLEEVDRNLLWAGEDEDAPPDEALLDEEAPPEDPDAIPEDGAPPGPAKPRTIEVEEQEAVDFCDWMSEHEPDVYEALTDAAVAATEMDAEALEMAREKLLAAEQYLVPEYPPLDEAQRSAMVDGIEQRIKAKEEADVAIASAVATARLMKPKVEEEDEEADAGAEVEPDEPVDEGVDVG